MLVNNGLTARITSDFHITCYAILAFCDSRRSIGCWTSAQTAGHCHKDIRTGHVDDTTSATQMPNLGCRSFILLIHLILRDGIMPSSTIIQTQLHRIFIYIEAQPVSIIAGHLHVHTAITKAFPVRSILHLKIHRAQHALRNTIAARIRIVAFPVGVFAIQANVNLPLRSHTAIRDDITDNLGFVIADIKAFDIVGFGPIFVRSHHLIFHVNVYDTIIRRYEFSISTNCRPSTVDSLNAAATDIDGRSDRADRLICCIPILISFTIRQHIHQTIDGNFRLFAVLSQGTTIPIHRLDDRCVIFSS